MKDKKITNQMEITCSPFDWYEEDDKDKISHSINAWCLNKESKSCLVRFLEFKPSIYIELPLYVNRRVQQWTQNTAKLVFTALQKALGEDGPYEHVTRLSGKLYYYNGNKKTPNICINFNTRNALNKCKSMLNKPFMVDGLGSMMLTIWADDVKSNRQMLTLRNGEYSGWFTAKGNLVPENKKISTLEREYIVKWDDYNPVDKEISKNWRSYPKLLSYDIESYSDNHNAFPVKSFAKHVAYMISCTFQQLGDLLSRKRYLIIMGDCDNLPDAEVIRVADEYELCLAFTNLIRDNDPDLVMGYNTFIFDDSYLDARLKRLLKDWDFGGSRLKGVRPQFKSAGWSSKQSRTNILDYIYFPGRVSFDMYRVVRKEQKLSKYSLNHVSQVFLNNSKYDVPYKEMFKIYKSQSEVIDKYERCIKEWIYKDPNKDDSSDNIYEDLESDLYPFTVLDDCCKCKPIYYDNVSEETIKDVVIGYNAAKDDMTKVSAYCVQDAELVIDLFEYFKTWIAAVEMSNTVGVRIFDVYNRGQQMRGFSMLYDLLTRNNTIMDYQELTDTGKFQGAYVGTPIPGLYEYVITLDFNSLYPSIIMAYNICYSTYIPPEVEMTEEEEKERCHVIEIEEDVEVEYTEDEMNEEGQMVTVEKKRIEHISRRHRFIKQKYHLGFIPRIVKKLVDTRKLVKNEMKVLVELLKNKSLSDEEREKIESDLDILDKRQLALKTAGNSVYGLLGIKKGRLPFRPGAESTTAKGRDLIHISNHYLEDNYQATVVYGDTDSTMFIIPEVVYLKDGTTIPGVTDGKTCYEWAKRMEHEISATFPDPLYLEFEKMARMLSIAPKKYSMWKYDPLAKIKNELGEEIDNPGFGLLYDKKHKDAYLMKGIILARRDNCQWQRNIYHDVLTNYILERKSYQDTLDLIIKNCVLFNKGGTPWSDLVIIKGLGSNYKDEQYHMKVFADHLKDIGQPAVPGERLEYLIVVDSGGSEKLGPKMRKPETYLIRLESKDKKEELDLLYYLEHVLMNCIQQLFEVGYKDEIKKLVDSDTNNKYNNVLFGLQQEKYYDELIPFWNWSGGDIIKTIEKIEKYVNPKKYMQSVSLKVIKDRSEKNFIITWKLTDGDIFGISHIVIDWNGKHLFHSLNPEICTNYEIDHNITPYQTLIDSIKNKTVPVNITRMTITTTIKEIENRPELIPDSKLQNHAIELRRKYIGSMDLFHPKNISQPIKQYAKAIRLDREKEFIKLRASPELFNELYP